ncbi:MAG TPA: PAS domain S-box protein [Nostocaceae cyanobacterium]|nr:PAS domain S-box protein [Nostocaceae cyanobacterium]
MKKQKFNLPTLENQYYQFFSLSNDLFCIATVTGYIQTVNPAWTKTLGWFNEQLIGSSLSDFIHPEEREPNLLDDQIYSKSSKRISFTNRWMCQDGTYKWLESNATIENQLIYIVARDISLQKEKEIQQKQYIQELEALKFALNAHSLVAITDAIGRITYANDQFCEVSQYSREELLGKDHKIINSGYHSPEFMQNLWQTIKQGKIWKGEIKNKAKDGSFYWVDTLVVPMLNHENKPYQYIAIRTDITQRKLSEIALLERSHLSSLSAEISLVLAQSGKLIEILENATETISRYLEVAFVGIWTFDKQTNQLKWQAGVRCQDSSCDILHDTQTALNHLGLANETISLVTYKQESVFNQKIVINQEENVSNSPFVMFQLCAYPLIIEQQIIGIMASFSQKEITEPTHNLLNWIANNVAVAIDRIWAREELFSRREALLLRLASEIRSSLDLDTILETAVNEIRNLLNIDRCCFMRYLLDASAPKLEISHESREADLVSMLGQIDIHNNQFLTNYLLNQDLVCINDTQHHLSLDENMQAFLQQFGITSQLILPIKSNSGELGVIICSHCSGERTWENHEISLLQAVTAQLAIAIDQSQLYTQSRAATLAAQTHAEKLSETLQKLQHTQAQLIQTEKMSSLGQLVAGVAHEINNPVNFIHGNLTHAKEYFDDLVRLIKIYQEHYPYPDPEIQDLAEEIDLEFLAKDLNKLLSSMNIGTNRIREIVLSLRNFSRLDEADKKLVNVHEGIENTLMILHHRWKSSGIGLGISINKNYGDLPLIDCYPGPLNQVFMNILTNAIDALEEAIPRKQNCQNYQPEISITTNILDSNYISIRIADNGNGMTEEVKNKLFDPFFTTKPVGKGTGLGLSISYQIIVDKHTGELKCFSTPGQGTEFLIQIPVKL